MQPEDVDLEGRTLRVRNDTTHSTKDNEERHVPLNDKAHFVLSFWKEHRQETPGQSLFFDFVPKTLSWLLRALKLRCRAAGVPPVTWYSLRHLFATTLAASVPELVLAAIMGHSDPRTTRRWYIHRQAMSIKAPPVI